MNITLDGNLLENIMRMLDTATQRLAESEAREDRLLKELDRSKLLNEQEAKEYLRRDAETLRYYRNLGLDSIKIGKDRWYIKGVIDDWLASGQISRHQQKK